MVVRYVFISQLWAKLCYFATLLSPAILRIFADFVLRLDRERRVVAVPFTVGDSAQDSKRFGSRACLPSREETCARSLKT